MALMKVKGNLERLFDKNLNDLVRGIRNHKDDEAKYIATCLEEIKQELRQHNTAVKANAVQKLTYLQMQGYDISWAGFNIVEVEITLKIFDFTFTNLFDFFSGYGLNQVYRETSGLLSRITELSSRH